MKINIFQEIPRVPLPSQYPNTHAFIRKPVFDGGLLTQCIFCPLSETNTTPFHHPLVPHHPLFYAFAILSSVPGFILSMIASTASLTLTSSVLPSSFRTHALHVGATQENSAKTLYLSSPYSSTSMSRSCVEPWREFPLEGVCDVCVTFASPCQYRRA